MNRVIWRLLVTEQSGLIKEEVFSENDQTGKMRTASLFTRDANGLQAWPEDRTTIEIPAKSPFVTVATYHLGDSVVTVAMPAGREPVCLYIPRGGSVVIEAVE